MSSFNEIKNIKKEQEKQLLEKLEELKHDFIKINQEGYEKLVDFYCLKIEQLLKKHYQLHNQIEYMRDNNIKDKQERENILKNYSNLINDAIPDYTPIVFYSVNDIGLVKDIIKEGILKYPNKEKIDVTYKKNINYSLKNADLGYTSYMPYGVLFVFKPLDNELGIIYKNNNIEVKAFNFKENPDRLYGIITTDENISRIQNWCLENKISIDKVFTHKDFLKKSRTMFNEVEYKHSIKQGR